MSTEALVRWQHPERGLIPPLEFIPIAEETGLIAMLGLQVLETACRQTAVWQRDLDPAIGVSVNVSGRQVLNPLFPEQVAAVAERSGLRAGDARARDHRDGADGGGRLPRHRARLASRRTA